MRRTLYAVLAAFLLAPATASADWRIDGRGWGHGIGLSQYGAYGFARDAGWDFRAILAHYYAGTRVAAAPGGRLRVRLRASSAQRVGHATLARAANGRGARLRPQRSYHLRPRAGAVRISDAASGRVVATLRAPVRVTGKAPLQLFGRAENGVTAGRYRGALRFSLEGTRVLAVGDVDLEHYLYGVVAGEMPAAWHPEALKAQAVVARSYALRGRVPARPWDVYADTRSQVYRGVTGEVASSTAAVRATRRLAVYAGDQVAQTFFFSTSGGRTAANEEIWGTAPVSYLRAVDDPHDRISPYHTWSVTLTDEDVAERLDPVLDGELVDVAVVARTPTGRAANVRVTGTLGMRDIRADQARTLLGLRSTWFTVTRADELP